MGAMTEARIVSYSEVVDILDSLPRIIRETRRRKGLSLRAAGREAGLSFMTIDRAERGVVEGNITTLRALLLWADS